MQNPPNKSTDKAEPALINDRSRRAVSGRFCLAHVGWVEPAKPNGSSVTRDYRADAVLAVQDLTPIYQSEEVRQIHAYLVKQHGKPAMSNSATASSTKWPSTA